MKKQSGRRSFLKKVGAGSVSAAMLPAALLDNTAQAEPLSTRSDKFATNKNSERHYNGAYEGDHLKRVAFPIGGMGAGMFCLEGSGAISHMSVRSRPEVFNEPGMFGAITVKGIRNGAKVVEGPVPEWKSFGQPDTGNGAGGTIFGLPRFKKASFLARFPFATITLEEMDYPLTAKINGWSPFIPNDADHSGLPVGALEYQFKNTSSQTVSCVFSFHSKNFVKPKNTDKAGKNFIQSIANGFILSQVATPERPFDQGDFAVFCDDANTVVDHCWFRGGWFDPLTMAWETIRKGETRNNDPVEASAPGASLYVPFSLNAGEEKTIRVMVAWYVPLSDLRHGGDAKPDDLCEAGSGCCADSSELGATIAGKNYTTGKFKPWYSNRFKNVQEVVGYWTTQYAILHQKSTLFRDAFYASTLPPEVIEAVAANLTILKSPTVMREYDGRLWAYEGCGDNWGCCHGSCTHVWNMRRQWPIFFRPWNAHFVIPNFVRTRIKKVTKHFAQPCRSVLWTMLSMQQPMDSWGEF